MLLETLRFLRSLRLFISLRSPELSFKFILIFVWFLPGNLRAIAWKMHWGSQEQHQRVWGSVTSLWNPPKHAYWGLEVRDEVKRWCSRAKSIRHSITMTLAVLSLVNPLMNSQAALNERAILFAWFSRILHCILLSPLLALVGRWCYFRHAEGSGVCGKVSCPRWAKRVSQNRSRNGVDGWKAFP